MLLICFQSPIFTSESYDRRSKPLITVLNPIFSTLNAHLYAHKIAWVPRKTIRSPFDTSWRDRMSVFKTSSSVLLHGGETGLTSVLALSYSQHVKSGISLPCFTWGDTGVFSLMHLSFKNYPMLSHTIIFETSWTRGMSKLQIWAHTITP